MTRSTLWRDSLLYPAYGAGLSVVLLLAGAISDWFRTQKLSEASEPGALEVPPNTSSSSIRRRIDSIGGIAIFAYRIVQLLGILSLLGIAIAQFVLGDSISDSQSVLTASSTLQAVQIAIYVCPCTWSPESMLTAPRGILLFSVSCMFSYETHSAGARTTTPHGYCSSCGRFTCTATSGL